MRLIDADALKADYGMKDDCKDCEKELQGYVRQCHYNAVYTKMDFCEWIDSAPTIEPERKPGKWIIYTVSMLDGEDCKCSECGQISCAPYWNFCPNCGAKMENPEDIPMEYFENGGM